MTRPGYARVAIPCTMRTILLTYGSALAVVLLQGCVTVGNPSAVDEGAIAQVEPLRSTQHEVRRLLGRPTHPKVGLERTLAEEAILEIWTYDYTHVNISPATLVPLLGPFLGHSTVRTGSVSIRFDAAGIVQNVERSPSFESRSGSEDFIFGLPFLWASPLR